LPGQCHHVMAVGDTIVIVRLARRCWCC
jgi:hypothetical protein